MFRALVLSVVFISFSGPFSQFAFSGDLDQVFEQLKDSGEDYRAEGSVCEQVARLDLQREYPAPTYKVVTGISYTDDKRVLGELDVVVFDVQNGSVSLISEVKCWKNLRRALSKAKEQRRRFQRYIVSNTRLQFYRVSNPSERYDQDQFETSPHFTAISQEGGGSAGFDQSLDFDLAEMKQLRQRLLDCQAQGACRRPSH